MDLDSVALDRLGDGFAVVSDDVLPAETVDDWLARVVARDRAGGLDPAGLGRERNQVPSLRSDHTAFVDPGDEGWEAPVAWFAALGRSLSEQLRLALPAFSLQIAGFPPGARYVRHVDTIRGDPARRLTATLYLDRSWDPEDEGQLRVIEPDGERDVLPIGGRLVLFRSDVVEHEVLPTRRIRYALTAWFGSRGIWACEEPSPVGRATTL